MFRYFPVIVFALGLAGSAAAADEPQIPLSIVMPGTVNMSFGTISPAEAGNQITNVTIDQGITWWRHRNLFAVAYGAVTLRDDTAGNSWNHGNTFGGGARLVGVSGAQVMQASIGMSAAENAVGTPSKPALSASVSYWRGWTGRHQNALGTPGSTWVASGLISAREPGDWITAGNFEQGVQVWRVAKIGIVPYAAFSGTIDTAHHDWNNRAMGDGGLKFAYPLRGGIVDVRFSERLEYRWESQTMRSGPAVTVDFWMGWSPHVFAR
jgi:hypothetical protein